MKGAFLLKEMSRDPGITNRCAAMRDNYLLLFAIFGLFCTFRGIKTKENRKKPVETAENPLTFVAKTPNVNFGTLVGPA